MKKSYQLLVLIFILLAMAGCSEGEKEQGIATISSTPDSDYVNTFKELNLGRLFDFNFELPDTDNQLVTLWVEGYSDGEKIESNVAELIYSVNPEQDEEGHLGFGILSPNNKSPQIFTYAPEVRSEPRPLANNITISGTSREKYAVGEDEVNLEAGETRILAVYREAEKSYKSYDPQNEEAIEKMIAEDDTVLLFKIKVEKDKEDGSSALN
ncbi:hypothetical protein VBD025_04320 [Virgibacillus flavescens]|uniref:hypothetical protein n=1 Tax=Virgibacillus flavescens TaxID=1611422 RepID=UPI003D346A7B